MRFVVMSDNHGDRDILVKIKAFYENQEVVFIHCGDSELADTDPLFQDVLAVSGNMDYLGKFPTEINQTYQDQTLFIAHGHFYNVNYGLERLREVASLVDANLVFYGHTHQLAVSFENQQLVLNPGSISQPRGQYANLKGTFAQVDVDEKGISVIYKNRQLQDVIKKHFTK